MQILEYNSKCNLKLLTNVGRFWSCHFISLNDLNQLDTNYVHYVRACIINCITTGSFQEMKHFIECVISSATTTRGR